MLVGTTFIRDLARGVTRPFIVEDEAGQQWVVKGHRPDGSTKMLFNELVCGRLASHMSLPWPRVGLITLSPECAARASAQGIKLASRTGVALLLIPSLTEVQPPPGGFRIPDAESTERNRRHIASTFPDANDRRAFYGKNVFDNWVAMTDTKYDTLFIGEDGRPRFLDASHAFGGEAWSPTPVEWDRGTIDMQYPYMHGVITERGMHEAWLAPLENFTAHDAAQAVVGMPGVWGVPAEKVAEIEALLARTRDDFLPKFREWLEWEQLD